MKTIYRIVTFLIFSLSVCLPAIADGGYPVAEIPDSLKKDAYAVVREYSTEFIQTNGTNGTCKIRTVITVMNTKGDSFGNFSGTYDKLRDLDGFQGKVFDAQGKEIRKIKKGDLVRSTINYDSFSTDNYGMYYKYTSPTYPYTVEYNYTMKYKNGIMIYPSFYPNLGYYVSIQKNEFSIAVPDISNLRFKEKLENVITKKVDAATPNRISYFANNLKAILYEVEAPEYTEITPFVEIAPIEFCYDSHCGNMSTWKDFGLWLNDLQKDKDALSVEAIAKMQELVKDAKTDREKVKILYKFLQDNSRYVSVQLGIGGLKPTEAANVYKNKFSDCKGLSNLMRAMLKSINIESTYCIIAMGSPREFYKDFANKFQSNHAILMVPLKNDSIWLECTSQTIPFGFIHDGIAGHDALQVTDKGGIVCRLPNYSDSQRLTKSQMDIKVFEEGNAEGKVSITNTLDDYESTKHIFDSKDREKVVKYFTGNLNFQKYTMDKYSVVKNIPDNPSIQSEMEFKVPEFSTKTGVRIFIPICPLKKGKIKTWSVATRNLDVDIEYGFAESDSITLTIPDSYDIETMPKSIKVDTEFGSLTTKSVKEGNKIVYTQSILIKSGRFDKSKYKEMREFYNKISKALRERVVIKKAA